MSHGKPIKVKPVSNRLVNSPAGGFVMLENLINNRFGSTMADGHYGEVDVSPDTLEAAGTAVQSVINVFKWKGPPQHWP